MRRDTLLSRMAAAHLRRALVKTGARCHTRLNPGEAWFEAGPDPVYAAASRDTPTGFARVMILPRTCLGKSSIRYVRPEDADKPKSQKYQIFADEFIEP